MNIKSELNSFLSAIKVYQALIAAGAKVRFIGGCVRDILISRIPTDIDLATNLIPDDIQNVLEENKIKYFSIGKEFGTVVAIVNKQRIEITTLRKDIDCDGRYAQVQFTDDWREDAKRRDFTINALSADIDGNIYDYFDGINDLKQKKVRFIGDAKERISEDYLRILRFFRFSAYFSEYIDKLGLEASKKYAGHLKDISGYRIRSEMCKIFFSSRAIEILRIMEKEKILQEVIPCDNDSVKRIKKLYIMANEFSYKIDELLYWSVLVGNQIPNIPFSREEEKIFKKLNNMAITNWSYSNLKKYWQMYKQYFQAFVLLNLSKSDIEVGDKKDLERLFEIPIQDFPITGRDLLELGVKPGKYMGEMLKKAEFMWYDSEFKITKHDLMKELMPNAYK